MTEAIKTEVAIRRANSRDSEAILQCLHTAFEPYRATYTPNAFLDTTLTRDKLAQRFLTMTLFVAEAEGKVVGTIGCWMLSADAGHLRGMAVLPEYQGTTAANMLLKAAEDELQKQGCKTVALDTTAPLGRAMKFYERNGYRRSGKIADFNGMPLYEYVKTL